jgi:hypothetical protein
MSQIEAKCIEILREAFTDSQNLVIFYFIDNGLSVIVHFAHKAFHPEAPLFPLLHVFTTSDARIARRCCGARPACDVIVDGVGFVNRPQCQIAQKTYE